LKPAQILAICLLAFPLVGTVSKSVPPHRAMSLALTKERVVRRELLEALKRESVVRGEKHDDWHALRRPTPNDVEAVELGHLDVEKDDVGP